jgi:hypothetical protein
MICLGTGALAVGPGQEVWLNGFLVGQQPLLFKASNSDTMQVTAITRRNKKKRVVVVALPTKTFACSAV